MYLSFLHGEVLKVIFRCDKKFVSMFIMVIQTSGLHLYWRAMFSWLHFRSRHRGRTVSFKKYVDTILYDDYLESMLVSWYYILSSVTIDGFGGLKHRLMVLSTSYCLGWLAQYSQQILVWVTFLHSLLNVFYIYSRFLHYPKTDCLAEV